jgi:Fe-coproporphyrin III synthase
MLKRLMTLFTDRIYTLPILILMPHSGCNCRCVMCDIWKANSHKKEISTETLQQHIASFKALSVREVVLSGGEALMHSNLWKFCSLLHDARIKITLLSTGLLLKRYAREVVRHIDNVIVSLDGSEEVHDRIRNVPQGFLKLDGGVKELKRIRPAFRVTGRCVLQRSNFRDFINIVKTAHQVGLDEISFLAADVSSRAFNHPDGWTGERADGVALNEEETFEFEKIINRSFDELASDYRSKFIAESPSRMRRIVQYYKAVNNAANFPATVCNAPWVSAVIESDGSVLPCFFHQPYGNINDNNLAQVLNSRKAVAFRKNLDMAEDNICRRCVCTLRLRPHQ